MVLCRLLKCLYFFKTFSQIINEIINEKHNHYLVVYQNLRLINFNIKNLILSNGNCLWY